MRPVMPTVPRVPTQDIRYGGSLASRPVRLRLRANSTDDISFERGHFCLSSVTGSESVTPAAVLNSNLFLQVEMEMSYTVGKTKVLFSHTLVGIPVAQTELFLDDRATGQ